MLMSRTIFGIQTNSVNPDQTAPRNYVINELAEDTADIKKSQLAAEELKC